MNKLTVKQAKESGVVFVSGDIIDGNVLGWEGASLVRNTTNMDHCTVDSFEWRIHSDITLPPPSLLPVIVNLRSGAVGKRGVCCEFGWEIHGNGSDIISWKPSKVRLIEVITKNEMGNQYTYELVTGLTTNEIAKAMIDGEVFYSIYGDYSYQWNGNLFVNNNDQFFAFSQDFYRRKEIETITRTITYPKPVSEPLNEGDEYWVVGLTEEFALKWHNDAGIIND